jgi:PadR family transcriptional regulator PadR
LLEHEWRESRAGPPRKYYALTKAGAQRLELLESQWTLIIAELDKLAG